MLPRTLIASEEVCVILYSDDSVIKLKFSASEDSTGLPLLFQRHFSFIYWQLLWEFEKTSRKPGKNSGKTRILSLSESIHRHVAELVVSPSP